MSKKTKRKPAGGVTSSTNSKGNKPLSQNQSQGYSQLIAQQPLDPYYARLIALKKRLEEYLREYLKPYQPLMMSRLKPRSEQAVEAHYDYVTDCLEKANDLAYQLAQDEGDEDEDDEDEGDYNFYYDDDEEDGEDEDEEGYFYNRNSPSLNYGKSYSFVGSRITWKPESKALPTYATLKEFLASYTDIEEQAKDLIASFEPECPDDPHCKPSRPHLNTKLGEYLHEQLRPRVTEALEDLITVAANAARATTSTHTGIATASQETEKIALFKELVDVCGLTDHWEEALDEDEDAQEEGEEEREAALKWLLDELDQSDEVYDVADTIENDYFYNQFGQMPCPPPPPLILPTPRPTHQRTNTGPYSPNGNTGKGNKR